MMTSADRWVGLLVSLLGVFILGYVMTLRFPEFSNDPGPAFMPKAVAVGLIVCGLGLLFWPKSRGEPSAPKTTRIQILRMGVVAASLVLYALVFNLIGFVASTFLFLTFTAGFLSGALAKKAYLSGAVVAAIVTALIYYVFHGLLNIVLPKGIF